MASQLRQPPPDSPGQLSYIAFLDSKLLLHGITTHWGITERCTSWGEECTGIEPVIAWAIDAIPFNTDGISWAT
nr:hypothetical protein Q903MT_gene5937 [Picea sitchensis]